MGRVRSIVALVAAAALAAPAAAGAYGWPLKPFDKQHPIRGFFNDPRTLDVTGVGLQESFHFGVDISAPDGTPVYAVAPGRAFPKGNTLRVRESRTHDFAYWHIYPTVGYRAHVRTHELVGYVADGFGHVHLAELVGTHWVNPLRRGALEPYADHTRPTIEDVRIVSGDTAVDPLAVAGVVDVIADAWDTPPITPPPPWSGAEVAPALIRWRLLGATPSLARWQVAVDFRWALMPQAAFSLVYAPGTHQNRPNRPGHYAFYVLRDWNTRALANRSYRLEVAASDTRGNTATYELPLVVAN